MSEKSAKSAGAESAPKPSGIEPKAGAPPVVAQAPPKEASPPVVMGKYGLRLAHESLWGLLADEQLSYNVRHYGPVVVPPSEAAKRVRAKLAQAWGLLSGESREVRGPAVGGVLVSGGARGGRAQAQGRGNGPRGPALKLSPEVMADVMALAVAAEGYEPWVKPPEAKP